jgi:peptidoglycan-associated lipoprotein
MATGEKFTATTPCEWEAMQIKEPEKEIVKEEVAVAALPKEEAPLEEEKERIQEPEAKAFPEVDVLFNFDRYALTDDSREILKEKADWLEMNGDIRVLIEGHCDERGTNAYNLALGERRAAAVKRYLIQLGIDEERLSTISYGEEMPLDPSTNEAAWAINRRVHFVIE